jgi:uncharacterized protein (TIGR03067 family)
MERIIAVIGARESKPARRNENARKALEIRLATTKVDNPPIMKRSSMIIIFALGAIGLAVDSTHGQQASNDRRNIIGVWKGGMPGDPPGSIELVITPGKITGRNPRTGESLGEGIYQLDPVKKRIDAHKAEKFGRGRNYVGIYSLEGNTLKWCSNSNSPKRPKDLVHRPETDQFLMILERQR